MTPPGRLMWRSPRLYTHIFYSATMTRDMTRTIPVTHDISTLDSSQSCCLVLKRAWCRVGRKRGGDPCTALSLVVDFVLRWQPALLFEVVAPDLNTDTDGQTVAHARTHTHTHAHTHARPRARVLTHTHARARARARTHTRTYTRTHKHTRAHINIKSLPDLAR